MALRIGLWTTCGLLLATGPIMAQQTQPTTGQPSAPRKYTPVQQPGPSVRPARPPARPNQPVGPQMPTLQRSPAAGQPQVQRPQAQQAPFRLTPQQAAELDRVLAAWEQQNKKIRTFECKFTRWEWDPVFADPNEPNKPKTLADGKLKFAAPDKGMFHVDGEQGEHWICDGKSVFEFHRVKKQLIEHKLPPELQGKAISDGPLPFLFGAEAAKMKQRYFLRIVTPKEVQGQIWLEAIPRHRQDAANFRLAELILTTKDMMPLGLQIYAPNGKNRTTYRFRDIVTNDLLGFLKGNPFKPFTPLGWTKVVEQPARPRVGLQPKNGRRRTPN